MASSIGTPGISISLPPDPLRQYVKHVIQFQQSANRNVSWNRSSQNILSLISDVGDIIESDNFQQLSLEDIVFAQVERPLEITDGINLQQLNTIVGGRLLFPLPLPPEVEYLSDTPKGAPLYIPQAGKAELAQADTDITSRVMGLASGTAQAGETGFLINSDWIDQLDWTDVIGSVSLTPNAFYYVVADQPGKLTDIAPTDPGSFVTIVGLALDETTMFVSITQSVQL